MWYRIKTSRNYVTSKGKDKTIIEYWLSDCDNFAEAGYNVMKHMHDVLNTDAEVEDVFLMKTLKPIGNNENYDKSTAKIFIVKFAEDFESDDGVIKTTKYPVPFYAHDTQELYSIIDEYKKQGLDNMRVTTISETKWEII